MGEGGTWLCVPRIKIKTKIGRDGKEGFTISLSEVLGLVQPWELLPTTIITPGDGGKLHHCCGFPTVSGGAANPVGWSTDTASALENAVISQLLRPLKRCTLFSF